MTFFNQYIHEYHFFFFIDFKKYILLIMILFLFTSANLDCKEREVLVGVFPAAPLVFVDKNKPNGLFIELIEYFSHKYNWKVVYVNDTWNKLLIKLEKAEIDILPAVGYTEERNAKYDFNEIPIYIDSGVLFTNNKLTLHTVFNLQGKRVAGVKGSIFTNGFINYMSSFGVTCEIVYTGDNLEVMNKIEKGDVDAGVCIYSLGNELSKKYNVKITPINFSPIALHFAVAEKKDSDLLDEINESMKQMVNDRDSFYSKSFQKWAAFQDKNKFPFWIWWGLAVLLIFGLMLFFWVLLLKQQVRLKTNKLNNEINERKEAEIKIKKSLSEKETLIKELFHRTKNTIQVIRSMMVLQASEYPNNKELLHVVQSTENRILSISLVQQMLYKSNNLSKISIKDYLNELTNLIFISYGISKNRITINFNIENENFIIDTAIPLGLIINEFLTNSLKHAFPDNKNGSITISLSKINSIRYLLEYSDNGIGFPENFDYRNQNTLGFKLIHNIAENQMMGKISFKKDDGIKCSIEFPTDLYETRI
jgi:two-component sensor histidine kinase/ABC-type amino acid transport substrate-binding protein